MHSRSLFTSSKTRPIDDDDDDDDDGFQPTLPDGWLMYYDGAEEKYYYYNALSGQSQWNYPVICGENVALASASSLLLSSSNDTIPISEKYQANVTLSNLNTLNITVDDKSRPGQGCKPSLRIEIDEPSMPDHMFEANPSPSSSHTYTPLASPMHRDEKRERSLNANAPLINHDLYYSDMDDNDYCDNENNDSEFKTFMSSTINIIKYITPRYLAPPRLASKEGKEAQAESGRSQDYLGLARIYKKQRGYCDPRSTCVCVLCNKDNAVVVFFPCEHRCVCNKCIQKEHICDERKFLTANNSATGYCNCPLCASVIKLMLTGGNETEKYWNWVFEVVPSLPSGFMKKWKHTEGVLTKVYIEGDVGYKERYVSARKERGKEGRGSAETVDEGCSLS